jgi:hypothetical protein
MSIKSGLDSFGESSDNQKRRFRGPGKTRLTDDEKRYRHAESMRKKRHDFPDYRKREALSRQKRRDAEKKKMSDRDMCSTDTVEVAADSLSQIDHNRASRPLFSATIAVSTSKSLADLKREKKKEIEVLLAKQQAERLRILQEESNGTCNRGLRSLRRIVNLPGGILEDYAHLGLLEDCSHWPSKTFKGRYIHRRFTGSQWYMGVIGDIDRDTKYPFIVTYEDGDVQRLGRQAVNNSVLREFAVVKDERSKRLCDKWLSNPKYTEPNIDSSS